MEPLARRMARQLHSRHRRDRQRSRRLLPTGREVQRHPPRCGRAILSRTTAFVASKATTISRLHNSGLSNVGNDPAVSAAGRVWRAMAADLAQIEFDRRKTLEGRAGALLTSSASMLTLIFGLTVLVTGKDPTFKSHWALYFLLGALASFVGAASVAIWVQTRGFDYLVVRDTSLRLLVGDEMWSYPADVATRADVSQKVNLVCSLRVGNNAMAQRLTWSLRLQLLAIALLSISVGFELHSVIWP